MFLTDDKLKRAAEGIADPQTRAMVARMVENPMSNTNPMAESLKELEKENQQLHQRIYQLETELALVTTERDQLIIEVETKQ